MDDGAVGSRLAFCLHAQTCTALHMGPPCSRVFAVVQVFTGPQLRPAARLRIFIYELPHELAQVGCMLDVHITGRLSLIEARATTDDDVWGFCCCCCCCCCCGTLHTVAAAAHAHPSRMSAARCCSSMVLCIVAGQCTDVHIGRVTLVSVSGMGGRAQSRLPNLRSLPPVPTRALLICICQ
jgi:hypothetical protein